MLPYNLHSHTFRCGHATGTDEEFVEAAIKAGFKELGFTDHVMLPGGEGSPKRAYLFPYPETLNDEFHVYAMEWTPESISFLVDGECFMTVPIDEAHDFAPKPLAGMAGFHDPHYVIFNNEIFTPGHGWCPEDKRLLPSDPFPIDYEIDWVRLWQKDGEALFSRK